MPVGEGWELPPGAEPWHDFHWFTASPRAALVLVVLSPSPVWYTGHFATGRMCPCTGAGCDLCGAGIGSQVRYAFGVVEVSTRRLGLIELGKGNGQLVRDWSGRNGGLRGMVLEVSKAGKSAQSRTEVRYVSDPAPAWSLGLEGPDPSLALYLTWHKANMPMPQPFESHQSLKLSQKRR